MTFPKYALFLVAWLPFGCGSTDTKVGSDRGVAELGEACRGYDDCAPVEGKVVDCLCIEPHDTPICVAELEVGDVCGDPGGGGSSFGECRSGSTCLLTSTDGTPTCVAVGGLGAPCTSDFVCTEPYTCVEQQGNGTCSLATAELGESCDYFAPRSCAPPNFCSFESDSCEAPPAIGATCDWNDLHDPCPAGAYCGTTDALENVCMELGADGAECYSNEECSSGVCFFGVCGRGRFPSGGLLVCRW